MNGWRVDLFMYTGIKYQGEEQCNGLCSTVILLRVLWVYFNAVLLPLVDNDFKRTSLFLMHFLP